MSPRVSAIVLAAGAARRMGRDKLALRCAGQPLLQRALTPLLQCTAIDELLVVVRPDHGLPLPASGCRIVVNAEHAEGIGASLRAGVRAAAPEAEAYLVALGDMPLLTAALLSAMVEAFAAARRPILVPVCDGRQGHPVIFAAGLRQALLQLRGDVGARALIARHAAEVTRFPTDDRAVLVDVDTPAELAAIAAEERCASEC